jgi:hypothetical protein
MLVIALILLANIFMPANAEACTYRGDLKITKTVESRDFHDVEFMIDVSVYIRGEWKPLVGSPVMLKHGDSTTFSALDGDFAYRVVERVPDCFKVDYKVSEGQKNTEFKLLEPSLRCNQTTIVDITNTPKLFDLEIIKKVYIDGDLDPRNQEVFEFEVDGKKVTASAINSGHVDLYCGDYVVTETKYGKFTPDNVTMSAIVTSNGGIVTFINRYRTPPPPTGSITVCKEVCGEDVDPTLFNFFMKGEVSTEGAVSEEACVVIEDLPYGEYYFEEKVSDGYTGSVTTGTVIINENNPRGKFTFVNCKECPDMGSITIIKNVTNVEKDDTKFQFVMEGYIPPPEILPIAGEVEKLNGTPLFFTSEVVPYVFEKMPYGTYYFREINIPEDYEGIVIEGKVMIDANTPDGKVVFENRLKTGTVTICKDVTNVVEDQTLFDFEVWQKDMLVTSGAVMEGEKNCVEIELPYGSYYLEEMVPEAYIGITTSASIKIDSSTPTAVKFVNEERRGKITVLKDVLNVPDDETGFQFNISRVPFAKESVTALPPIVSEVKPFVYNDLPFDTYYFEEIVAPGYIGQVTTGSVMIDLRNPEGEVEFVNIKECPLGSITIKKDVRNVEDDETEFPFMMTGIGKIEEAGQLKLSAEIDPFVVSEVKDYVMEGIAFGTYEFEEIVPEGYEGIVTTGSVTIDAESRHGELTFVNDKEIEYFDVYVYKEFTEGTAVTDMAFDYRIFSDVSLTESSIVVESNVMYGYPDGPNSLPAGTYYIDERPYEGWMMVPVQEVLVEGPTDVTLTNTAIEEPVCHMTIDKKVDGEESVRVKRDVEVEYTVEFHNDGDMDLWFDFLDSDGEDISITETCIFLEVGATTERAFPASYGSTGTYTNVATATYCCESCGEYPDGYPIDHLEPGIIYQEECTTISDSAIVVVYKESRSNDTYRMKITKEADADEYEVGDMITYTITVENTGNQTLTDIEVTDPMVGLDEIIERLPYSGDDTVEFTVEYEATEEGTIENTAYAKDDRAPDVEDDETVVVIDDPPRNVPNPGLSIVKTITGEKQDEFKVGDQVWFNLVVTNTGETDLENIEVRDPFGGYFTEYVRIIAELDEGESVTLQDAYMVIPESAVDFDNIATATTGDLSVSDNEFVDIEEKEFVDAEDETPLDLPAAGTAPMFLFYGLAVLVSGLGMTIKKRR